MTSASIRLRREALARARAEHYLGQLRLELATGAPRRHLDPLVELLELLIERSGSNLYAAAYRRELAVLRERVEASAEQARDHCLRLITGGES